MDRDGSMQIFMGSKLYSKQTVLELESILSVNNINSLTQMVDAYSLNCPAFLELLKLCQDMQLSVLEELLHLQLLQLIDTAN